MCVIYLVCYYGKDFWRWLKLWRLRRKYGIDLMDDLELQLKLRQNRFERGEVPKTINKISSGFDQKFLF